jgi:hypothetical protein
MFQELSQTTYVATPVRRELKQDRTKFLSERFRARQEIAQTRFRVFELFHMGYVPARLDCETETFRSASAPTLKRFTAWQPIKAIVQLNGIKLLSIEREHLLWLETFWIKLTNPVFVVISRCTHPNPLHSFYFPFLLLCLIAREGSNRLKEREAL